MTWFDATRAAIDVSDAATNAPPMLESVKAAAIHRLPLTHARR
jgi:hypothetical protein